MRRSGVGRTAGTGVANAGGSSGVLVGSGSDGGSGDGRRRLVGDGSDQQLQQGRRRQESRLRRKDVGEGGGDRWLSETKVAMAMMAAGRTRLQKDASRRLRN